MPEDCWRDVTCNCRYGLVAGLGFGEFRDRVVVKVVETESTPNDFV